MQAPYYPILYVRGYAMTEGERDETAADPFCGFNLGSTVYRAAIDKQAPPKRFVFESPVLRLASDFGYTDVYEQGADIMDADWHPRSGNKGIAPRSIVVYRYYDSGSTLFGDGKAQFATSIPSFSQVGPQVVGELRDKALLALAVSLFVTVIYIRVRFAEYSYGVAAMVALVHDVLVTLAALSIGNHFGIVNGELNLAMIAVFLTIIGYSVNDTIVIFDRVRENLPKSDRPLREILNTSINETLSRTIMTSVTVFLAILVQYIGSFRTGNVLESISFAMIFGTLSGVYSTVYIANPIFLWMETRSQKKKGTAGGAQARALREATERKRAEEAKKELGEGEDEAQAERV